MKMFILLHIIRTYLRSRLRAAIGSTWLLSELLRLIPLGKYSISLFRLVSDLSAIDDVRSGPGRLLEIYSSGSDVIVWVL